MNSNSGTTANSNSKRARLNEALARIDKELDRSDSPHTTARTACVANLGEHRLAVWRWVNVRLQRGPAHPARPRDCGAALVCAQQALDELNRQRARGAQGDRRGARRISAGSRALAAAQRDRSRAHDAGRNEQSRRALATAQRARSPTRAARRWAMTLRHRAQVGEYTVLRFIGAGGFGEVFEAREKSTQHRVALKLLHNAGTCTEPEKFKRQRSTPIACASARGPFQLSLRRGWTRTRHVLGSLLISSHRRLGARGGDEAETAHRAAPFVGRSERDSLLCDGCAAPCAREQRRTRATGNGQGAGEGKPTGYFSCSQPNRSDFALIRTPFVYPHTHTTILSFYETHQSETQDSPWILTLIHGTE